MAFFKKRIFKKKTYGSSYAKAFKARATQLTKQPGLAFVRRTFNAVVPMGYPKLVSYAQHQAFTVPYDIHWQLGRMTEYTSIAGAYKFVQIKNIKVIFHFINDSSFSYPTTTITAMQIVGCFPIIVAYDGSIVNGSIQGAYASSDVSADNGTTAGFTDCTVTSPFSQANNLMSIAKSKMISSTPDVFACQATNSRGILREQAVQVSTAVGTGNYGGLYFHGIQPSGIIPGTTWCTVQIILDCLMFEQ